MGVKKFADRYKFFFQTLEFFFERLEFLPEKANKKGETHGFPYNQYKDTTFCREMQIALTFV